MEHRNLGNSDIKVSLICLGTMTWGYQNSESEAHAQMDYAVANGVNFFDTAEMYPVPIEGPERQGRTEEYIGSWFAKSGKRKDVILATKIIGGSEIAWIRPELKIDGRNLVDSKNIHAAIDSSLKRLQSDYIDLYQIHWPSRRSNYFGTLGYDGEGQDADFDRFEEIITTLDALKKAGKIRCYGLSNETPYGVMQYLRYAEKLNLDAPVSIQNPYSLLNRTFEIGLSEMAIRCKIGLLPYSPLGFGSLSGKYLGGKFPENARMTLFKQFDRYLGKTSSEAIAKYVELAKTHNLDAAQMALAFVNSRKFVTSNIIGATNLDQLKSNIASAEITLSDAVLKGIEAIHAENSNPAP